MRVETVKGEKRLRKKRGRPAKRLVGSMTDEAYKENYPEAWEIFSLFDKTIQKAGYIHADKFRIQSKIIAVNILKDMPKLDLVKFKRCIKWCFTPDKETVNWYGRIKINHLGTILTLYNSYIDWAKEHTKQKRKGKPGNREEFARRQRIKIAASQKKVKIAKDE